MPARTQAMIRRGINRLNALVSQHSETHAPLAVIKPLVETAAQKVNDAYQSYQQAAVTGDKERAERDTAIAVLLDWVQHWRPVVMMLVSGASDNIRNLPSSGATPDDVIHVAEDMQAFIQENTEAAAFREQAISDLGTKLDDARKETSEAVQALPAEAAARSAYSEACIEANGVLVRSLDIVRAIFGRTAPEYKQFIGRASASEEEEMDAETALEEQ